MKFDIKGKEWGEKLKKLTRLMEDVDVDAQYIASKIDRSWRYVDDRLKGRGLCFTLDEVIVIADLLNIPFEEIPWYFFRFPSELPPRAC